MKNPSYQLSFLENIHFGNQEGIAKVLKTNGNSTKPINDFRNNKIIPIMKIHSNLLNKINSMFIMLKEDIQLDGVYRGYNSKQIEPEMLPFTFNDIVSIERLKPFFQAIKNDLLIDLKYRTL